HLAHVTSGDARVGEGALASLDGAVHELRRQELELAPLRGPLEAQGSTTGDGEQRDIDLSLDRARQLVLGLLRSLEIACQRHAALAQIEAVRLLELADERFDDPLVEIFSAEGCIAAGCFHAENAARKLEDGDVERPTPEIVDGNALVPLAIEPVCERGGGRLVE